MDLYNKEDVIDETYNYLFFEYGLFNKQHLRFLNIYQDKMRGRFCLYKDYDNPKSKKRIHYILPNQKYILLKNE
tara:strand:+ start:272 stop:493 length:222 start_codon:yes stop_codon:yes gene_type:complete